MIPPAKFSGGRGLDRIPDAVASDSHGSAGARSAGGLVAALMLSCTPARAETQVLAKAGGGVPDGNGTFANFNFSPHLGRDVINDAGELVFRSQLAGTSGGADDDTALFRFGNAGISKVVRKGDLSPDGNGTIGLLQNASITAGGRVRFGSSLQGLSLGEVNHAAIFSQKGGIITLLFREGLPAIGGNGTVAAVQHTPGEEDDWAALVNLSGTPGGTTDDSAIYTSIGGVLTEVAREGVTVPGGNGEFGFLPTPRMGSGGDIAFGVFNLVGTSAGELDNGGIFGARNGGVLETVVREGNPAPDGNGVFDFAIIPFVGPGGNVSFTSFTRGTSNSPNDTFGAYFRQNGVISQIARTGQPGPQGGGTIRGSFSQVAANDTGMIAFGAFIGDVFPSGLPRNTILRWHDGALEQIARVGDIVPNGSGTLSSVDNGNNSRFINEPGVILILAGYSLDGGVTESGTGLVLGDENELVSVIRSGDVVDGETVEAVSMGYLNLHGQVAFVATLAGGGSGVCLHSPELRYRRTIGGTWDTAGNWTLGLTPASMHAVTIDPAAGLTVLGPSTPVSVKSLAIGATTSGVAELRLQAGGTLSAGDGITIGNRGRVSGSGTLGGAVTLANGGEIAAFGGDTLTVNGAVTLAGGEINAFGGSLQFQQPLVSSGVIQALDGTLAFTNGLTNTGTMNLFQSVVNGIVHSPAGSTVNSIFGVTFNGLFSGAASFPEAGPVTFNGGYAPGDGAGLATFPGAVSFGAGNTVFMEIGGTARGLEHDAIDTGGLLTLGGGLNVALIGGFVPAVGQSFDLFDAAALAGGFSNVSLPSLPSGMVWNTTNLHATGVISVDQLVNLVVWTGGTGVWNDPSKWNPNAFAPNNGNGGFHFNALQSSGTINLDANITVERFTQTGGTLTATSAHTLALNDLFAWAGGVISGTTTVVAAGGIEITGANLKQLGNGGNTGTTVINQGAATLGGGSLFINPSGGANPGSSLVNEGTFTFTDEADIVFSSIGGTASNFTNAATGIVTKLGAGTTSNIGVAFHNAGAVQVTSGTLGLTSGGTSTGSFTVAAGAVLDLNSYILSAGTSLTGPGSVLLDSGILTVNSAVSSENFDHTGGTLRGVGTLTATETYTWTGGIVGGVVTVVAPGGIEISGANSKQIGNAGNTGATVINQGAATFSGGSLFINPSGGANPGSSLVNEGTFHFTDEADIVFSSFGGSPSNFANAEAGIVTKSGAGTTSNIGVAFNNAGVVQVNSGTLGLTSGGTSTGSFTVAAGAVLDLNTYTLDAGTSFTGPGSARLDSGILTVNSTVSGENFDHTGGTLTGAGTLTATESYDWTGGIVGGSATAMIASSAALNLTGPGNKQIGNAGNTGGTMINQGSATFSGGSLFINPSGGANPGSSLVNEGSFHFIDEADIVFSSFGGSPSNFTNAMPGIITKIGVSTTSNIGVSFHNAGAVQVTSGTLGLIHGGTSTGSFAVSAGAVLDLNTYTLDTGTSFSGPGSVLLDSGVLTLNSAISVKNYDHTGGTLTGTGSLTATESYDWTSGTIGGSATVTIAAGATLNLNGAGNKQVGNGGNTGAELFNAGTTNLSGGNLLINTSGGASPGSSFVNQGAFHATAEADITFSNLGGSAPNFTNAATGTFTKSGAGTTTALSVPFQNAGIVQVDSGNLQISSTFTQTAGSLVLNGGGITAFSAPQIQGGTVSGSGSITGALQNSGGTISPGLSAGTLAISGNLTLGGDSTLVFEIGGTAPGTQHDFLSEAGTTPLALAGELRVFFLANFHTQVLGGDVFTILTSNQTLSGNFANVTNGARLDTADGRGSFQVNYGASSSFAPASVVLSHFIASESGNFADWIAGFSELGGLTSFDDDPDGDGLPNGIENFLGTHPGQFDAGLTAITAEVPSLVFHHPRSNSIASDIIASYEWSADLTNWHAAGKTNGQGISATISDIVVLDEIAPANDLIKVTVTITSGTPDRIVARIRAVREP